MIEEKKSLYNKLLNDKKLFHKNDENEKIKKEKEIFIEKNDKLSLYQEPTLIGLNNIGATCFMNATLQCLSQTKLLTIYFLNEKCINRINYNISLRNEKDLQLVLFILN